MFTEINSSYLEGFKKFLIQKKKNKGSTIQKNIGNIRTIIDSARKQGLIFRDPFEDFEPVKLGKTKYKPKLSYQEIQKIENLPLESNGILWHARNAFILSFYLCGMRFGDLATLKWENVSGGTLEYQMSKTGNTLNVEISEGAEKILSRYRSENSNSKEYIFPFCAGLGSNGKVSDMVIKQKISSWNAAINGQNAGKVSGLKKIAELAEIDKSLSMHVARHSFAQHMADKGVSIYKMMILLGHKSLKVTEQYLDTINVKVGNDTLKEIF